MGKGRPSLQVLVVPLRSYKFSALRTFLKIICPQKKTPYALRLLYNTLAPEAPPSSDPNNELMMMSGFTERVINNPQTRYRSAKQMGLQMSSERRRGESCGSQSGWQTVPELPMGELRVLSWSHNPSNYCNCFAQVWKPVDACFLWLKKGWSTVIAADYTVRSQLPNLC